MVSEEAEECKQRGNEAFKDGKWDEAIKHYNKAIALDPTNAAYYSNRSGAWASKGNHESALADANKCLGQDSQFVKGYARKGTALFGMNQWDEAEAAYKEGLQVDPNNEACKRGVSNIAGARQRRRSAPASSGGYGDLLSKIAEKFKKGGRMQSYLVILVAYYAFTSLSGRFGKKEAPMDSEEETVEYEEEVREFPKLGRHFAELEGNWYSYLQLGQGPAPAPPAEAEAEADSHPDSEWRADALLLLHRSSLSAQGEFGSLLPRLAMSAPGLQVLAPDRPCHGYSPCQVLPKAAAAGEEAEALWLPRLIAHVRGAGARSSRSRSRASVSASVPPSAWPQGLLVAASGREAAGLALHFASLLSEQQRPPPLRLWLLAPHRSAPQAPQRLSAPEGEETLAAQDYEAYADLLRWAATASAAPGASDSSEIPKLTVPGLPQGCQVRLLYGEEDSEDEALASALQQQGVQPKVRIMANGQTLLDGLLDEVRQFIGDGIAPPEEP